MITYITGDLFESPAKVLVNTVNTVGVMGKGIAKQFKTYYPDMFREYQRHCESGALEVGKLWLYRTPNKLILNFPTKKHWRQPSKPEFIEAGLKKFVESYAARGLTSVAFPRLGCGNGELDWEAQVRPLMKKYLLPLPIDVLIYVHPHNDLQPEHLDSKRMAQWLRQEPETLAFTEVWSDLLAFVDRGETIAIEGIPHTLSLGRRLEVSDESGEQIELETIEVGGEHASIFSRQDLLEVWQSLRASGICRAASLPRGLDAHVVSLFALLERLPYVIPVRVAGQEEDLARARGLQLAPARAGRSLRPSSEIRSAHPLTQV